MFKGRGGHAGARRSPTSKSVRYQASQDVLGVVVCYSDQEKRAAGRQQLADLSRRSSELGVKSTHKECFSHGH